MEEILTYLLLFQAVLGGIDTLYNHEYLQRLRARPESRQEVGLHAVREAIFGTLFAFVPWFHWLGWSALAIPLLLAAEIGVTLVDELVENETRVLPANERLLHVLLTANVGAMLALGVILAAQEWGAPAFLESRDVGWVQVALLMGAAMSFTWSALDTIAWRKHRPSPA